MAAGRRPLDDGWRAEPGCGGLTQIIVLRILDRSRARLLHRDVLWPLRCWQVPTRTTLLSHAVIAAWRRSWRRDFPRSEEHQDMAIDKLTD